MILLYTSLAGHKSTDIGQQILLTHQIPSCGCVDIFVLSETIDPEVPEEQRYCQIELICNEVNEDDLCIHGWALTEL